jgi:general L-amino acid transport system permease protein
MSNSFIRTEMLPPVAPPVSQRGIIKWLRENLFSGWLNSILTVLAMVAVFYLLNGGLPWIFNGIWTAENLADCRQQVAAMGEGASAACWAVLVERWHQFIYGFYPMDLYWRPTTAFALMFVALAPVLYYGMNRINATMVAVVGGLLVLALIGLKTDAWHILLSAVLFIGLTATAWFVPKKLVWVTLAFPAVSFYLLWGGSVWGPIGVVAGFGLLVLILWVLQRGLGVVVAAGVGLVAAAVWWLWLQPYVTGPLHSAMPIGLQAIDSDLFGGFLLAFVIGVAAISASLPFGILLALGRRSDMPLVKSLSVGFIEFIRGVPLITMLFTASLLLQYFLPPQTNFDLILRVIILVTLFASAYIAEVVRGGLAALPRGQYEAADALGLDYWQAQRLIIMPQALKISIPGIVSSFIGLFKDTTLVALVGLADPLVGMRRVVLADQAWKGLFWEPFIFVGIIFFVVCFGMSRYSMYLEQKLKTDHR